MVNVLGIDVAKDKLDVVLVNEALQEHSGVFANHPTGCKQLQHWLSKRIDGELHVCLEATGQYSEAVAEFLYQAGYIHPQCRQPGSDQGVCCESVEPSED